MLLWRAGRGAIDLTNRAQVVGEVSDRANHRVQFRGVDFARRSQDVEPPLRFAAKPGPELCPLLIGDRRLPPTGRPVRAVEWLFPRTPAVHERKPVAQVVDVRGD